jgi:acetyl CoA:N6-hydroxylysine acetyl transferase
MNSAVIPNLSPLWDHDEPVQVGDHSLREEISFRRVLLEEDLDRLHNWQHQEHVIPYWQLNLPLPEYRRHLEGFLSTPHQTLCIGQLNGVPVSYFESYWAAHDRIGAYYEAEQDDQGVHLLIGPPAFVGRGYALPLLRALVRLQLRHPGTERIIAEPDARNSRMRHIFEKCGFRMVRELQLPEKRASLMILERSVFEKLYGTEG